MGFLKKQLLDYLATLSGERPDLVSEPASKLPLFLRDRYQIHSIRLFGRRFLLALEREGRDPVSPGEYETQAGTLSGHLGEPVVLVLSVLQSYDRNRLVCKGVPFIVPGSQAFLPTTLIDLRERQPIPKPAKGRRLTPAAQCLVLYHLQRESLAGSKLQDIAGKIGYSPIMLTQVKAELKSAGICEVIRTGRATTLDFLLNGRNLWEYALPLLSAPDRLRYWVRWKKPGAPALLAGFSALSRHTMIEDDRLPTYALWKRTFRSFLEKGVLHVCPGREEANVCIEAWSYDPITLSDGEMVDPLSLYLSLRDSPDERVQKELQTLLEKIPW